MSSYFDVPSNRKETIKKSASRNIRFIQAAISIVKSTHLKPYSCKFSKKVYTQHQLLGLVLFKDFRNQHYREFIEDVEDMEGVQEILHSFRNTPFHNAPEIYQSDKNSLSSVRLQKNVKSVLLQLREYSNNGYRLFRIYKRVSQPLFLRTKW